MPFKLNFTGVNSSREKVDPGVYKARVEEIEYTETKNTKEAMLRWKFVVVDGEFEGTPVYGTNLLRPNTLWVVKDWMIALGKDPKEMRGEFNFNEQEFLGDLCGIIVETDSYGPKVRSVIPVEELDQATARFAAAEQAKPQDGGDSLQSVFKI
jgi:hypothetical protein